MTKKISISMARNYLNAHGAKVVFPLFNYYLSNALAGIARRMRNTRKVECNFCGYNGNRFYAAHFSGRTWYNTKCPNCGSLPRYRLLLKYLKDNTNFYTGNVRLLEIAPIKAFQSFCRRRDNIRYVSADLSSRLADLHMDITRLALRNDSFDIIICYHVLEHVKDDIAAMRELHRVLKHSGFAIVQVPLFKKLQHTIEYDEPNAKEDNHVRRYGLDYKDRLEEAGFSVNVHEYFETLPAEIVQRYGLSKEDIYFLTKRLTELGGNPR